MKILVAGATGFIGRALMLKLSDAGHGVVALTREPVRAGVRLPVHCRVLGWDPLSSEPPADALTGVDAVVNLVGENVVSVRWTAARKQALRQSRILSTRRLVRALGRLKSRPRVWVNASAIGYYGERGADALDEREPSGGDFLAELCRDWESEALEAESLGVRAVVLRIGMVLGKWGGAMKMILPLFRLGLGGALGGGGQWMSWIHADDAAGLILHAINHPTLRGPVNAVSPYPVTQFEFTRLLARELRRPAVFPVPAWVMKSLLGERAALILASQRVVSRKAVDSGYSFLYPRLNLALREVCNHFQHELRVEQWLPRPLTEVFAFFSDPKNLAVLTPEFLRFRMLGQSTEKMGKGTLLHYKIHLHGIPIPWKSKIVEWENPSRFADVQTLGPYGDWFHTHEFIERDGGTLLCDKVMYRLPFDVFTDVFAHPFVRRDLENIFLYRHQKAAERFGAPPE